MDKQIYISIITMAGLGAFFAVILALVDRSFRVEENPNVMRIMDIIPGVNCAACGYKGCYDMAEHLVKGDANISSCPVAKGEVKGQINDILGLNTQKGASVPYAVIHCQSDNNSKRFKAEYSGVKTCQAANIIAGGFLECGYGCLGFGDCSAACPFDAIKVENGLAVIDYGKCTGCASCVKACPRNIISIEDHVEGRDLVVISCSSKDAAKDTRAACDVGCIACRICEKLSQGAYNVKDNLSVIDYGNESYIEKVNIPVAKCPTKCINRII